MLLQIFSNNNLLQGHDHHLTSTGLPHPSHSPQSYRPPPIPTHNKPITDSPNRCSFNVKQLRKGFGFRNVDNFLKHIHSTCKDTIFLSSADREPILDLGEVSTIDKNKTNTSLVPLPDIPFNTVHCDIVYGSQTALGGVRYALFLVDK